MIKNIVFDFGQVLVKYDFEFYLSPLFGSDEKVRTFLKEVLNEYWIARIDREDVPLETILTEMKSAFPQYEKEIELFGVPVRDYVVGEVPGMKDLLIELKDKGYRLFGLSNWCHMAYSMMPKYDIFTLLEGIVISSDEKLVKPEPAIYRRLLDKFSLNAEECVFIDDRQNNIEGAESVGIHGILFKDAEALRKSLEAIL